MNTHDNVDSLMRQAAKTGPNYHTLAGLERLGLVVQAKSPADIPTTPHCQIQELEQVVRYSGYESDGPSQATPMWRLWIFKDDGIWNQFLHTYYTWLANPSRTRTSYNVEDVFVGVDCSGRVCPQVKLTLSTQPRR